MRKFMYGNSLRESSDEEEERHQYEFKKKEEARRIKERNRNIVKVSIMLFLVLFTTGLFISEVVRIIGVVVIGAIGLFMLGRFIFLVVDGVVDEFMD